MIQALSGNTAVAYAMKQVNPDVVAVYPITPQTVAMERFADYVADGDVDTELIMADSEHSAMSCCIGASLAGGRVMTSTASAGLALMWEVLYVAASNRCPIVMNVMNRALSAPINIHCDHSDAMGARDSSWIQIHAENVQEAYDNIIQAVRIAEHENVRLPVMTNMDGFTLSHATERLETLDDQQVQKFIGKFKAIYPLLDVDNPVTYGPLDLYDYYFEHKRQQVEAMELAYDVVKRIGQEYGKVTGRSFDMLHPFEMDDAEIAVLALGSTSGTARVAVRAMRQKGVKVGLVKLRVFRPFPKDGLKEMLKGMKAVAVMDRSDSYGAFGGPVFSEVRSALLGEDVEVVNYIYGLGGRDIRQDQVEQVITDMSTVAKTGKVKSYVNYLGVR
ncbi:MAG: pyruvate ferredoxin oxidoreductase [Theionarchaea archaeon]|nr:pyruvate ferredoxin oxidoreductase [Theionarchaea archaeon]MBU7000790.1 pyruvate ferredoxin oxidoreductase [Theionarchaea archaeon]MBU7021427.1 pyruvate ferredoxin oxidoreductase [Theionarchaea archaeon]MBU7033631.1 pyruvate ferredoxin oxidoreductase [Theionarchaea archaeon]MBU7041553.1 pyruvate ferredoxin oxidoreductase [Theionarchaea archaeon]